jgi:hypothetical protein
MAGSTITTGASTSGGALDIDALTEAVPASGDMMVFHDQTDDQNKKVDVDDLPSGTPPDESITNAKLAHIATARIKGRNTAGTGDVEDLTASTVRSMLNVEDGADVTDAANVGAVIHAASAKTALHNNDKFDIIDTEASNVIKTTTWTNIKSLLTTLFDTLYQAVLVSGTNIKTVNGNSLLGSGDVVVGDGGGETNTMANVGDGAGQVYKEKTGAEFKVRSIKAGTDISVTNNTNDITIAYTGSGGGASDVEDLTNWSQAIAHSSGNLAIDFEDGVHAVVTLTTNVTFDAPTNPITGFQHLITFIASGSTRTINIPSTWFSASGSAGTSYTLTTTERQTIGIIWDGAEWHLAKGFIMKEA